MQSLLEQILENFNIIMAKMIPRWWLFSLMSIMTVAGTCNTMVAKIQDMLSSDGNIYWHPYFQTATMFVGELMCLFVYLGDRAINVPQIPKPPAPKKPGIKAKLGPLIFALPAAIDLCGSTLMMIGLGLTYASVYQMLRGSLVVVVALYSVVFLKRTLFRHHYVGVVCVTGGVLIVGLGSVFIGGASSHASNPALGAILIVVAQFVEGWVFIIEEKFFGDITVPPLLAVGTEGCSGVLYFCILLPILYAIPCYNQSMCSGHGHVENFLYAFKQLGYNGMLMFTFWAYIFCISFYNWSGLSITKNASSLHRSIIDNSRILFVWIIDMILGWEIFYWVQLIGCVLLAFGTLVYNEVLILPFWGFREAVVASQEELARRKNRVKETSTSDELEVRLAEDME